MSEINTEYDTPWKESIENYFPEFIEFFYPEAYQEIDWEKGYEFLEKELQQITKEGELGKRLVDKLVKVYRKNGEEKWVLVHIEVQNQEEKTFAERMYIYHYRIYDKYKRSVASLAVLGDERKNWRPNQFKDELWGCEIKFKFPVIKLLDYKEKWAELEASENPFATVVMAHLKAKETSNNSPERLNNKLYLTRRLYERGYSREDIINLFRFIDWVMNLPEELEREFWQEVKQLQEEKRMPYMTSIERMARAKGLEEGKEQGIQEGMREGILAGIAICLRVKFGEESLEIMPEISQIQEGEKLREILTALARVNSLAEVREIYQQGNTE